jgi:hypothetical protein
VTSSILMPHYDWDKSLDSGAGGSDEQQGCSKDHSGPGSDSLEARLRSWAGVGTTLGASRGVHHRLAGQHQLHSRLGAEMNIGRGCVVNVIGD